MADKYDEKFFADLNKIINLNEGSMLFEQLNENNKATLELVEKVLSTKVYIEKQSKQLDFK